MECYKDFRPTAMDHVGLGLSDRQDWLVAPCSRTRDTADHDICVVNFDTITACFETTDPESNDHEIHRFGHWGPGWFEVILVRPGSACARDAEQWESTLADYPVADGELLNQREHEAACEEWESMNLRERIATCAQCGVSILAARHDTIPDGVDYEVHSDGIYFI